MASIAARTFFEMRLAGSGSAGGELQRHPDALSMRNDCADQSSAWTKTDTDRSLATLEKRHAELLRLRDEVEQLSWKIQRMGSDAGTFRRDNN